MKLEFTNDFVSLICFKTHVNLTSSMKMVMGRDPEGHLGRRMGISGAFTNWVMNELQLLNLAGQSTLKSG